MSILAGLATVGLIVAVIVVVEHICMRRRAARANRNLWAEAFYILIAAILTGGAFATATMIGPVQ